MGISQETFDNMTPKQQESWNEQSAARGEKLMVPSKKAQGHPEIDPSRVKEFEKALLNQKNKKN